MHLHALSQHSIEMNLEDTKGRRSVAEGEWSRVQCTRTLSMRTEYIRWNLNYIRISIQAQDGPQELPRCSYSSTCYMCMAIDPSTALIAGHRGASSCSSKGIELGPGYVSAKGRISTLAEVRDQDLPNEVLTHYCSLLSIVDLGISLMMQPTMLLLALIALSVLAMAGGPVPNTDRPADLIRRGRPVRGGSIVLEVVDYKTCMLDQLHRVSSSCSISLVGQGEQRNIMEGCKVQEWKEKKRWEYSPLIGNERGGSRGRSRRATKPRPSERHAKTTSSDRRAPLKNKHHRRLNSTNRQGYHEILDPPFRVRHPRRSSRLICLGPRTRQLRRALLRERTAREPHATDAHGRPTPEPRLRAELRRPHRRRPARRQLRRCLEPDPKSRRRRVTRASFWDSSG